MPTTHIQLDERIARARAEILADALPWINRMAGATFVIKYGGSAMEDKELCRQVIADVVLLKHVGVRVVLVHGGGKSISALMEELSLPVSFHDGLRVTDEAAMRAVSMALVGEVNQGLVAQVNAYGDYGVGLSGADGRTFEAEAVSSELGRVGRITHVNTQLVAHLLDTGCLPVIASIGWSESGFFNINADVAASALASALGADSLIYLSDVDGLYRDPADRETLISALTLADARALLDSGTLSGGMVPKVGAAANAIAAGVGSVRFLNGTYPHSILLEVFTTSGFGTMFTLN